MRPTILKTMTLVEEKFETVKTKENHDCLTFHKENERKKIAKAIYTAKCTD